ncbi:MAG: NAD(P)-dependent oxidoreductase, partial [Desulfobacula sp.]|nr:NAD(P)-dependent oxidoreductase [Desulfobacula sp.]
MKIGFIGLGNVGGKLAGSLQNNGFELIVRDIDKAAAQSLLANGAQWAESPKALAQSADIIITCLGSPAIVSVVMESEDGVIAGLGKGKIWLEMSTTDEAEVKRIGALV